MQVSCNLHLFGVGGGWGYKLKNFYIPLKSFYNLEHIMMITQGRLYQNFRFHSWGGGGLDVTILAHFLKFCPKSFKIDVDEIV